MGATTGDESCTGVEITEVASGSLPALLSEIDSALGAGPGAPDSLAGMLGCVSMGDRVGEVLV